MLSVSEPFSASSQRGGASQLDAPARRSVRTARERRLARHSQSRWCTCPSKRTHPGLCPSLRSSASIRVQAVDRGEFAEWHSIRTGLNLRQWECCECGVHLVSVDYYAAILVGSICRKISLGDVVSNRLAGASSVACGLVNC